MPKSLLASCLAATIALTSISATPARAADSGEIGRFLLGAGTLFIIGSALSNKNKNRSVTVTRHYDVDEPRVKPRRKLVPSACLRNNRWSNGPNRFFSRRCLNNNMANVGRLPNSCLRTIYTNRGSRLVYSARCLRNNGWRYS